MRLLRTWVAAAMLFASASAAAAAEQYCLNLPGGRLGDVLVALGRQAEISVGVSDPAVANIIVSPIKGKFTVDQALRSLLRGKAARHHMIDARTVRIVRRPVPARRPTPPPRPSVAKSLPARIIAPTPPQPAEVAEIVVTATKRSTRLGSYPGDVVVLPGDDPVFTDSLAGSQALVSRLPNLASTHFGPGRNKLFLRGIADSSFTGTAQATVGQYLGETRINYNSPDPDLRLYDLDRVEVLAGPQGTIYGAGSLGGIVHLIPNAPVLDRIESSVSIGASNTDHGEPGADVAGVVNLPLLADRLGVRLVGYASSEGGYIDDWRGQERDVNDTRVFGGRAHARLAPDADWLIDASVTGQRIRGDDAQFADRDAPPLTRRRAVAQFFGSNYFLANIVATKAWDEFRFVGTTSVVRQKLWERFDSTLDNAPPRVFDQRTEVSLFSVENRLSRELAGGEGWLIGASFIANLSEQSRARGEIDHPTPITGVRNRIAETAIFGEATLPLNRNVSFTLGGRFTYSGLSGTRIDAPSKLILPPVAQETRGETRLLPSGAVAAKAGDNFLFFARLQQGFRPGGFTVFEYTIQPFNNDKVTALEIGTRYGRPGVGLIDAAVSFAYTRWSDIQADATDFGGRLVTTNIGEGRIYTADLRVGWRPFGGVSLEGAAVFNDSLVTNPEPGIIQVTASPLPNVARFNGRIGAEYRSTLLKRYELRLSTAARYVGKSILGIGPLLGHEQGDWTEISFAARVQAERHAISISIGNLLDHVGNRFALGSPHTVVERRQVTPLRPRTIRLGWTFGF